MSCATCFPNSGKNEISARWRLRLPQVLQGGQAVGRHAQEVNVEGTIALHVTSGTGSVTEGTSGTRLLDMSEWCVVRCLGVHGDIVWAGIDEEIEIGRDLPDVAGGIDERRVTGTGWGMR